MIPKVIHYCWFGNNKMPIKDRKCIESWRKFCPDYKIIEWNEKNYDLNKNLYMKSAYKEKKWGFVPDYARFDIIYEHGGFYLDTDVELIKPLDELIQNKAYMGFEGGEWINGGIGFGAEAGNDIIKDLRDMYLDKKFYNDDGTMNLTPSPIYITNYLMEKGLKRNDKMQLIQDMKIYPTEYFAAKNYETGKVYKTKNTISIHQYNASWQSKNKKILLKIKRIIGIKNYKKIIDIKNKFLTKKGN